MGVSENRVPNIATQKFRILIIRTPKLGTPSFSENSHISFFGGEGRNTKRAYAGQSLGRAASAGGNPRNPRVSGTLLRL